MTENSYPGPMTMVKIDGATIKRLREQQGLTQLYLATAVEVTTDTISRWENKRYPSIKKENGIRLAEALDVDLEDLLETGSEEPVTTVAPSAQEKDHEENRTTARSTPKKKIWPLILLSTTLLTVLLLFLYFYTQSVKENGISAERILPPHANVGQAIPVVIRLTVTGDDATSMILKENLPVNAKIIRTSPEAAHNSVKGHQVKWLGKVKGQTTYSYIFKYSGKAEGSIKITGTIALAKEDEIAISGNTEILLSEFHWADNDRDYKINDLEILTVYDQFSEVLGLEDEIDMIEEIWLGSGYSWNTTSNNYEIIE